MWSSNFTSRYILKKTEGKVLKSYLYAHAPSSIMHNRPKVDEWVNKMWYSHTTDYYSASKKKEVLTHATMWVKLEDNRRSEISQAQEDTCRMIIGGT